MCVSAHLENGKCSELTGIATADAIVRRAKNPSTKDFGYMVGEFAA
jgi:hypothetical protein